MEETATEIELSLYEIQHSCGRRIWVVPVGTGEGQQREACACGQTGGRFRRTGRFQSSGMNVAKYKTLNRDALPDVSSPMAAGKQLSLWLPD